MRRFVFACVTLGLFSASSTGCLIIAASTAVMVANSAASGGEKPEELKDGWLEQTLPYPAETARAAAEQVLTANALPILSDDTRDDGVHAMTSRYGDGLDVRIEFSEPTPESTAVRIHVGGPEGDLGRSSHLMKTIAEFAAKS